MLYVPAAVVTLILTMMLRGVFRGGKNRARDLHPYEAGYLDDGAERVVHAALAVLRTEGAIAVSSKGRVTATGAAPSGDMTPIDQAIHQTIAGSRETKVGGLRRKRQVRAALRELNDSLVRERLAMGPAARQARRLALIPLVLLIGVGGLRVQAAIDNDKPYTFLGIVLGLLCIALLCMLWDPFRATRSGEKAVRDTRERYDHLNPRNSPAWSTYGAHGAAFGVALFGGAALMSIDPEFALASEIHSVSGGGSSSGSGGSGDSGGGGGCGGGGGGGGCGG
ncbi:TIGR04222 domain-containing membrane protein [Spirillospora sp. CA-294931]|uniref:TIGR04222 domain-containing membrane protein n=1 Tax=Spirillospora sp. CA-294931 TaxID=3240042 RepID=UPI003D89CE0D